MSLSRNVVLLLQVWIICSWFLSSCVSDTTPIRCYTCTSVVSSRCGVDSFDPSAASIRNDCRMCSVKIRSSFMVDEVERSCDVICPKSPGLHCCQGDLCNSGRTSIASQTVVATLSLGTIWRCW